MYQPSKKHKRITQIAGLALLIALPTVLIAKNMFTHRFVRTTGNLASKTQVQVLEARIQEASRAGYNGMFHDDPGILFSTASQSAKTNMTNNLKQLVAKADALKMAFIPMSMGQTIASRYEIDHAEAFPVIGTEFVVSGTQATPKGDPSADLVNGDFEAGTSGWTCGGWGSCNLSKVIVDPNGKSGKCVRIENPGKNFYIMQGINLKPQRAYRISVWIKTANLTEAKFITTKVFNPANKKYLYDPHGRTFQSPRGGYALVTKNMNWTQFYADFNSLTGNPKANLWLFASYRGGSGSIWFDEIQLEEVGLYDTMRRETLPITVKSKTGTIYTEGKDYVVGKEKLTIPAGSAIKSGDQLLVNWFQMADVNRMPPPASYCHQSALDKVYDVGQLLCQGFGKPRGWFLKPSEWRLGFYDPGCRQEFGTSTAKYYGVIPNKMADMLKAVVQNCNLETYLWNDVYDPYHNAGNKGGSYNLSNGSIYGSWNYLDPKTVIVNWNVHNRLKSLMFYSGKDAAHKIKAPLRQIVSSHNGATGWLGLINQAEAKGMPDGSVVGIQYCSWNGDYSKITALANSCKGTGRWQSGPIPFPAVSTSCKFVGIENGPSQPAAVNPPARIITAHGGTVRFNLETHAHLEMTLCNAGGRTIRTLAQGLYQAGAHKLEIGSDELPAGVYFVSLKTVENGLKSTAAFKKIILM